MNLAGLIWFNAGGWFMNTEGIINRDEIEDKQLK